MRHLLIFSLSFLLTLTAWAQTPIGKWKTIDDETGREKSIVEISERNGKLYGKVLQLFRTPDEDQDPICDLCKGDKKDKKVIGMEILWDMEKDDDEWDDGEILDPKNGKVYSCKLALEGKDKLMVRGYLGFSLLGRTQYWHRVK